MGIIAVARCDREVRDRIAGFATAAYPNEGCGVLIGARSGDAVAIVDATSGRNMVTDRRRDRYDLDPGDIVRADREARARGLDVVGIWHSHPDHPARPSALDSNRAWIDYVYIICTAYAHGIGDCNAFTQTVESGPLEPLPLQVAPSAATGGG